jgi:hypothetical protein
MLKNYAIPILLLALFGLTFTACDNGLTNSSAELSDVELITAIQSADKMAVSLESLPSSVRQEVNARKNVAITSNAHEANGLGFAIEMRTVNRGAVGEASNMYFNAKGRMLQNENVEDGGNGNSKGKGKGKPADKGNNQRAFELAMPYQVVMPDESVITITTEDDYVLIRAWYQENPGTREKFTLVFPVTVVIDGEEVIMDQDAFEELTASQRNDRSDNGKNKGNRTAKLQLQMPYQVEMPDGSLITIETKEDRLLIRTWYEENPAVETKFVYVFPLTVLLNGEEIVVNSTEELQQLRQRFAPNSDRGEHKACFEVQYPITLIMPDGSLITIESVEEKGLVRAWYAENEDYKGQRPTHQFPITLLVKDEDGEQVALVINSQEELDAYREANCSRSADDESDEDSDGSN